MISYGALTEYALGEINSNDDLSTPDVFSELLKNEEVVLKYIVEMQPFNEDKENKLIFPIPVSTVSIGEFSYDYFGGIENLYFSDRGLVTEPDETPSNTVYEPIALNPYQYDVSILNGDDFRGGSVSFGAIRLANSDNEIDYLTNYYWGGRYISVYAGGVEFSRNEFSKIFDGLSSQIEYDEEEVTINIRDKASILETEFDQNLYEGSGGLEGGQDIEGNVKPLCYGVLKNVTPTLIDATTNIYQIHDGSIESIDSVFDRGVDLTFDADYPDISVASIPAGKYGTQLNGGYIKLGSTPAGRITCDLHGDNVGGYISKAGAIVQRLAKTKLGFKSFNSSTLDEGAFNHIDSVLNYDCGFFIGNKTDLKNVLDSFLLPMHIYWTFNRRGQLTGGVISSPSNAVFEIDENQVNADEIECIKVIEPAWRIKLGYGRNWTIQNSDELAAGASASQKEFAVENYRTVINENRNIRAKTASAVERQFNSNIESESDALSLLNKLNSLYGVKRKVYRIKVQNLMFRIFIGDFVNLNINKFDLNNKKFLIVGISEDAESNDTVLELWG